MLGRLQVLAARPLQFFVILHIIIVGVDDELRESARLLARRTAENRSVGERHALRPLFIRLLHRELLWLPSAARSIAAMPRMPIILFFIYLLFLSCLLFRNS